MSFANPGFAPIGCPAPMFARGKPVEGDYLVEYEGDGCRSFSPGQAFEDGYRRCDGLTYGDALDALKAGKRVARAGWNGKGMWVVLIRPGKAMHTSAAGKFPMSPCFGLKTAGGDMQPGWVASQADQLAED